MSEKQLVLGGARSGKSRYAEQRALNLQKKLETELVYIATATAGDDEMRQRIEQHQRRRDQRWRLIEEPLYLARALTSIDDQAVVLIDCLTLWLSNCLHQDCWGDQRAAFLDALRSCDAHIIIVSNEVGSGIVPMGALSREFSDQSGWLHQDIAKVCDQVDLIVAGLPLALKSFTKES